MLKALALALMAGAAVAASPVPDAIAARDAVRLDVLSRTAPASEEKRLAEGAALALRHKDDAALAILLPLSGSAADDMRAGACLALADIALRQGRYADTRDALRCVREASGKPLTGEVLQVFQDAEILAAELPMQLKQPVRGVLDASRDSAGLIRVPAAINGRERRAVIDTDASFSVLSESQARRLGVRVLEPGATVLTSTRPDLPMHLGIADTMQFGDAELSHVLFAVLRDRDVRFGGGYSMDVVIRLPVFVALGRIALTKEDGGLRLAYGAPGEPAAEPNLVLSGLDPFVLAKAGEATLRLAIDTASDTTVLNATALQEFPALADGASSGWMRWQGGGGAAVDRQTRTLPDLTLDIGGRPIHLRRIKVLSSGEADRHDMIGQDVLKQGRGWSLDFTAMRFAIDD